jgi:hypothetical protein
MYIRTMLTVMVAFALSAGSLSADEINSEGLPSVESILERYVQAVGGRAALEQLSTRTTSGIVTTDLTSRQQPILESHYFETQAKSPAMGRIQIWTGGGGEIRGFNGDIGWLKDKCGTQEKKDALRTKPAFIIDPQGPLNIDFYFPGLQVKGQDTLDGKSVYVLVPTELDHTYYSLYFDIESGLLVSIGHYWSLLDYQAVDGVLFPFRIHTSRKGGSTVYEFREVKHNETISNALFAMPGAVE